MRFPILALLFSLPTAVLAQASDQEVFYSCADRRDLNVMFLNQGDDSYAVINEAGHMVMMAIAESASGARYVSSDGWYELWTKGDSATLTLLGENETVLYRDCTVDPRTAAG